MGNFKETRKRISSVQSTGQITKAMKMVSAAKLRKAQDNIIKIRPYALKLKELISRLSEGIEDLAANPYYSQRVVMNILMIPMTSDKGLCSSFNSNVIKETVKSIKEYTGSRSMFYHVDLICIGKKGNDYFKKNGYNIVDFKTNLGSKVSFSDVEVIAETVLKDFREKKYDVVKFIYNNFKNPAVYYTTVEQFLPIIQTEKEEKNTKAVQIPDYIFEPNEEEIVNQLVPASLKVSFYRAILESNASEHGARMTAMDKATENAKDIISELTLKYNQERQAAITKEIVEIVSGSNALQG